MKIQTEPKDSLFTALMDQLFLSTGTYTAGSVQKVLSMAWHSAAWKGLTPTERANLSFQIEMLCKFLKEFDSHSDHIRYMARVENKESNPKQLQYA